MSIYKWNKLQQISTTIERNPMGLIKTQSSKLQTIENLTIKDLPYMHQGKKPNELNQVLKPRII